MEVPGKVWVHSIVLYETVGTVAQRRLKLILKLWISEWAGLRGHWPACKDEVSATIPSPPFVFNVLLPLSPLTAVCSPPLLPSSGRSSCCRWSWLSWNCRATFPVVLATSCSIFCLMTALQQDYWGRENLCHLDACCTPESMFIAFARNRFSWFRSEGSLKQKCLCSAKWGEIHRWVK